MKNALYFILAFLFLMSGCTEDPPTSSNSYIDIVLKEKIIGTWSNENLTYIFERNGEFQKSVNYIFQDTVIQDAEIMRGKYDIIDGVMRYTDISEWFKNYFSPMWLQKSTEHLSRAQIRKIDESTNTYTLINDTNVIASLPEFNVKITNNLLYFYPLEVLTPINTFTNSIWNNWTRTYWVLGVDEQAQTYFPGKGITTFDFREESNTLTYGVNNPFDTSSTFRYYTVPIIYNPPEVSIENFTYLIEFQNNELWLILKLSDDPTPLVKEN